MAGVVLNTLPALPCFNLMTDLLGSFHRLGMEDILNDMFNFIFLISGSLFPQLRFQANPRVNEVWCSISCVSVFGGLEKEYLPGS